MVCNKWVSLVTVLGIVVHLIICATVHRIAVHSIICATVLGIVVHSIMSASATVRSPHL